MANTRPDTLFEAFSLAFADYEIRLDKIQLEKMLKRRGFDPALSFAAFENDKIIAFTLNGTGTFDSIPTAYDTGTGTLKEHRGKGIATAIFNHSIPYLKKANIRQYLLEVLQHNTKAVSVYRNLGFEVAREFNYFIQEKDGIKSRAKTPGFPYSIRQIDPIQCRSLSGFQDFPPSWQNSFESIERASEDLTCLGLFAGNTLAGYCIFEPGSGDITQIAVDRHSRRKGIGSLLFEKAVGCCKSNSVKVVNTETSCSPVTRFLEEKNIGISGKQFEMIKLL